MSPHRPTLLALALLASACASAPRAARPGLPPPARANRDGARDPGAVSVPSPPPVQGRRPAPEGVASSAIEAARSLLGSREIRVDGVHFGDDCAALVLAAFVHAGAPLPPGVKEVRALHGLARDRGLLRRGEPRPGDVVFLSDRPGGPATHVGLVEAVGTDGTARVLHRTGRGVARLRLNARLPWKLRGEGGRLVNDALVTGAGRLPAARLLVGWASLY